MSFGDESPRALLSGNTSSTPPLNLALLPSDGKDNDVENDIAGNESLSPLAATWYDGNFAHPVSSEVETGRLANARDSLLATWSGENAVVADSEHSSSFFLEGSRNTRQFGSAFENGPPGFPQSAVVEGDVADIYGNPIGSTRSGDPLTNMLEERSHGGSSFCRRRSEVSVPKSFEFQSPPTRSAVDSNFMVRFESPNNGIQYPKPVEEGRPQENKYLDSSLNVDLAGGFGDTRQVSQAFVSPSLRTGVQLQDRYSFEWVLHEERESIERRNLARSTWDKEREHRPHECFSVAFSGGGVRAASFQAGVLWQLAAAGQLKNVEYFVAVSGGSYVASSFISQIVDQGNPRIGQSIDEWYLDLVARTICRMQDNASYLVRDLCVSPCSAWSWPKDGSSMLPRIFDCPILFITIAFAIFIKAVMFLALTLLPITEFVVVYFAGTARLALCAPNEVQLADIFIKSAPVRFCFFVLCGMAILTVFLWFLSKVFPPCRYGHTQKKPHGLFLFGRSTLACLTRAIFLIVMGLFVIVIGTWAEIGAHIQDVGAKTDEQQRLRETCANYEKKREKSLKTGQPACSDIDGAEEWYKNDLLKKKPASSTTSADPALNTSVSGNLQKLPFRGIAKVTWMFLNSMTHVASSYQRILYIAFMVLVTSFFLQPFIDGLFLKALFIVGPLVVFCVSSQFVRMRVFGPLTQQTEQIMPWMVFCFLLDMLLIFLTPLLSSTLHLFYARSLQRAYFAKGQDVKWHSVQSNVYAPFLLLTGTASDYVTTADNRSLHEISFSCLHTGSHMLGYVRPWSPQSLAKCSALSGAITDAFVLGMKDRIKYRFWLEVLNIGMGDFILFQRSAKRWAMNTAKWCPSLSPSAVARFSHRLPCMLLGILFYGLLLLSVLVDPSGSCTFRRPFVGMALAVVALSFVLSFFGYLEPLGFLLHSPGLRHWHQLTRFHHTASRPPELLYVMDGGLEDCSGVIQLMRRRCLRILLVLAAEDPSDEFRTLRRTFEIAADEKMGSFFCPNAPERDVRVALDSFREDKEAHHLHLCIDYGWLDSDRHSLGHLFIVKVRLPTSWQQDPVRPLLEQEEIVSTREWETPTSGGRPLVDLNGCCCDCCHKVTGGCFDQFPHYANVNQCLTPQMFGSMCRLGFKLSASAIQAIAREELDDCLVQFQSKRCASGQGDEDA